MKVFISSTSKDLGEYRQAAHEVCNRLSLVPIGMELFESMGAGATEGSRFKLKDADVYVGILANRYGYIEDGFDRSVTELEYEYAESRGIECLFFVAADAAALPTYPGDDLAKLASFKTRVDKLIRSTFENPWEFKFKLYDSLVKWMFRQPGVSSRRAFEPILADYSRFGGRANDLTRVEAFLADPKPGYLAITAPAGYGKTALAVKILQAHRDVAAYHFFSSLYRKSESDFLSEQFFLTSIVEQMKLWQLSPAGIGATPTTLSGWVAAYHDLQRRPLAEPRILLLDGLDEVKDWSLRPYLNVELPDNLKVIVTIRDVGQKWKDEYGFPGSQTTHLPLDGLTRADVAELLTMAGPVAAAFAGNDKLLNRVVEVTTPDAAVKGADPLYVTFLADDIERQQVTAANIAATPRRLEDYLKTWWETIQAQAKTDSAALDVLGTLAAALGPIGTSDLVGMYPHLASGWMGDPIARVVGGMRRVIAGSDAGGYAFAHPRFRDYVRRYPEIQLYEAKLLAYCSRWNEHRGRYALRYAIRHLAAARRIDDVFSTVYDDAFRAAQADTLGSARQTLNDLATALTIAIDNDRFLDVLRCAGHYRHLAQAEGIAQAIFDDAAHGRFESAVKAIDGYGFAKTSSAWVMALRCYLVWAATTAGDRKSAEWMAEVFDRQFGLGYHGANLHTTSLCDALIASAVSRDPDLAGALGVAGAWAAAVVGELNPPPRDAATRANDLVDLEQRIRSLEFLIGEHPEGPEYIDEVRAGDYMKHLRHSLIGVARDPLGPDLIRRALGAVQGNPYPRYRDLGLVAIGEATLAVPDPAWTRQHLQTLLEIGLEKEGITFTFDLAAHLTIEAARRGLPPGGLADYVKEAANSSDRWGTRMRTASATAAAQFAQGDQTLAFATLESAAGQDQGFAGYMSVHLLALASRWLEFSAGARIASLDLMTKALSQAQRVRDPHFNRERQTLVGLYRIWLAQDTPDGTAVLAMLRSTPDPDTRRAYKDVVTARWAAEGRWNEWGPVVVATLADATALDFVLARLAARAVQQHRSGAAPLSDDDLREAVDLCARRFATSRPWKSTVAAEYA